MTPSSTQLDTTQLMLNLRTLSCRLEILGKSSQVVGSSSRFHLDRTSFIRSSTCSQVSGWSGVRICQKRMAEKTRPWPAPLVRDKNRLLSFRELTCLQVAQDHAMFLATVSAWRDVVAQGLSYQNVFQHESLLWAWSRFSVSFWTHKNSAYLFQDFCSIRIFLVTGTLAFQLMWRGAWSANSETQKRFFTFFCCSRTRFNWAVF